MIPGTTPTHTYTLPLSEEEIENLRVTYEQGGKIVCQKEKEDGVLEANVFTLKLSQQDTLGFTANAPVRIQLKALTTGGDVLVSEVFKRPVSIVLDKEEI